MAILCNDLPVTILVFLFWTTWYYSVHQTIHRRFLTCFCKLHSFSFNFLSPAQADGGNGLATQPPLLLAASIRLQSAKGIFNNTGLVNKTILIHSCVDGFVK